MHAHGGSLNGAGPAIVNGMLFVNTGYTNAVAGNVLLAFAVDRGDQQQKQVEAANHQAASALDLTSADNQASSEQRALHYKGWSIRIPPSNPEQNLLVQKRRPPAMGCSTSNLELT